MTNPNDSLFPSVSALLDSAGRPVVNSGGSQVTVNHPGLTKRELFAALAMQGCITPTAATTFAQIAADAVAYADALIAALNARPGP
jgi:hypothetical protein